MRTWIVILLGIAGGCGVGMAASWARYGRYPEAETVNIDFNEPTDSLKPPPAEEPQPKVAIDQEEYDFGDVEQGSTSDHNFVLRNTGIGTLHLQKGGTSCAKCTMNELSTDKLAPGESTNVKVSYHANGLGPFRQSAIILTNDRDHRRVALVVHGKVVTFLRVSPTDIVFSRLSVEGEASAEVKMLTVGPEPLVITGHEFTDAASADHYKLDVEPLSKDELEKEEATGGARLRISVLPGLPVGPLRQRLRLTTNQKKIVKQEAVEVGAPDKAANNQDVAPGDAGKGTTEEFVTVEVPIQGRVESDISVIGAGWNSEGGYLDIGQVKSSEGKRRQVFVMVHGPHRHDVQFTLAENMPDWVQFEQGKPEEVGQGNVVKIPLTIVIPKGSPPANHTGSVQGKMGRLVLDTHHPEAKQLKLYLKFFVEN